MKKFNKESLNVDENSIFAVWDDWDPHKTNKLRSTDLANILEKPVGWNGRDDDEIKTE